MASVYQSANTRQSPVPPQEHEHSPLALAKRTLKYLELHSVAGDIVRQAPQLMEETSQRLQAEGKEVPLGSKAISDPHKALLFYDLKMNETPTTFLDHYYQFHYASSAAIILNASVIGPLSSGDPAFFKAYSEILAKLVRESKIITRGRPGLSGTNAYSEPSMADRAANRPLISLEQAEGKLQVDIGVLKTMKFYTDGAGDPDEAGEWKIASYISHEDEEDEYKLRFDGLKSLVPYTRTDLIELLTQSVQLS